MAYEKEKDIAALMNDLVACQMEKMDLQLKQFDVLKDELLFEKEQVSCIRGPWFES